MTLTSSEMTRLRADLAATLPDQGTVTRPSAASFDKETLEYAENAGTEVWSGACRVQPTGSDRVVAYGEQPITVRSYHATLPHDADGIEVDDVLVLSSSVDADLVGRALRVLDVQPSSLEAARRLLVEDQLG